MKTILKTITGSQLHGLANENSDTDYRGVFMEDLNTMLSPYKKVKNTSWIEGDEDNTAYELTNFCKMCTQGNPSALEVLWSDQVIEEFPVATEMRLNRDKFLDSTRIFEAHRGYAHNQYKKMNLFEPDERTPKFAIAYIRSLQQGIALLKSGTFSPQVIRNREFLLDVKNNFDIEKHPQALGILFQELSQEIIEVHATCTKFVPDIEWIENFILRSYTK